MTSSVIIQGKYRQRKDGSASSIPTLVSLEEETSPVIEFHHNGNGNMLTSSPNGNSGMPPKPPRRSSLAIGLLNSRLGQGSTGNSIGAVDKTPHKRRSSIAVAFLGRYNKVGFCFCFVFVFFFFSFIYFIFCFY